MILNFQIPISSRSFNWELWLERAYHLYKKLGLAVTLSDTSLFFFLDFPKMTYFLDMPRFGKRHFSFVVLQAALPVRTSHSSIFLESQIIIPPTFRW